MIALLLSPLVLADEGMWLPEQVPAMAPTLTSMGLGLDATRLADPLGDPLGAVVSLGGCTAAFLSADGLIGTNGHCIASFLEYASDPTHNYGHDGYLAANRGAELWGGPSARLWMTEKIEDVTAKVNAKLKKSMKDPDRQEAIDTVSKQLVADCERAADRSCQVLSFYDGREYRLVTRLEIKDLRVVYVPPESIYAFGGDDDNWMWPRHCGDFALLRAYVGPDGKPAPHAAANIPYHPPRHLSVQPAGAKPGDFVMIAGYPGSTYRYRTAQEAEQAQKVRYPDGITLLNALITTARGYARADADAAARLQQPVFNLMNARKSYGGMVDNFAAAKIVERKRVLEAALDVWVAADPARTKKYAAPIAELRSVIGRDLATYQRDRLYNGLSWSGKLLGVALTSYRLASELDKPEVAREAGYQERDRSDLQDRFTQVDKSLHLPSDRALLRVILVMTQELPSDQRIPPLGSWIAAAGGIDKALDQLYASTGLTSTDARLKLLASSRADLEKSTDPWVRLAVALEGWHRKVRAEDKAIDGALARLRPTWMDALREFQAGQLYPDANGSLRLSFGRVDGYTPKDGMVYLAQTSRTGMVRKAGEAPFDAPMKILQKPAGSKWVDPGLKDVPIDFLSTVDNTGGNSGSPTLNAKGEVVGFVFDRNWDAVAADWIYDAATTRSIHADIRYLLWLLDDAGGGEALLKELMPGG